ncbi:MAG: polymer-forming cytoskeletal protein [Propionivibrio sp.]|uniref:bactofilin family protein n=1 Tax=Propionivibrio sp. TaxID=2212460 RepID=UPI001A5222BB|nr:polymer-forming cytoskeletal protein [Propionivibrio sp.]MBL8415863.1 polymer-forming cytoskeletal protein [Propionivibrio sp.]
MFNKPGAFGRNDPITRRDAQPLPGSGSPAALTSSDKSMNAAKETTGNPADAQTTSTATVSNAPVSATIAAATRESSANDNVMGARLIVGPDVKLKGAEILDCDTLVVEGRVEATMDSRVIRIAEKGSFAGKVSIDIAEILGTFEGELTARSQLIIHSTGRVSGTIRYGKLVIDEGGELCGDINVLSEKVASQARPVVEPFVALSAAAG